MKKRDVNRPYRPLIVDADTAAYLLCMARSTFEKYVELGILPQADFDFGNLKRWRWETIESHIERRQAVDRNADIDQSGEQADPYLRGIRNGSKTYR